MDDEQTVRALLGLRDEEGAPPSVDLAAAMRMGRSRLRRRRTAQLSAGAVVAVAVVVATPATVQLVREPAHPAVAPTTTLGLAATSSPSPSPSPSPAAGPTSLACVESRLPVPQPNQEALVIGADPTGHYLVGRVYKSGHSSQVIIWHDGQFKTLTMSGSDPELRDITPNGVAVGTSFPSGLNSTGWIYQNGRLSKLKGPYGSQAVAIADNLTIGGTESKDGLEYPIVWHSPASTAVRLPLPGPNWLGSVDDVDSDGTIVGTVRPSVTSDANQGIVWHPDGSYQLLPLPTGVVAGANGMEVHSIRDGAIVAAGTVSDSSSKTMTPVLYRLSTGEFTALPGADLFIEAGNAQGWVAGSGSYDMPAVYTPTTGIVRLPTLVPHGTSTPPLGIVAGTISDDGLTIGGQDVDAHDVIHAVRWSCH
ncbi:hypothetical protein [Rugosimonospora africana]|uniref:Uncharacterized protein n=1 Tax=Rugosimonospora africana TaxID=556532 RepID=A0A8J3VTX8_9ACTN|nr:hypothetical protein [Rugosimonospora africana]GIH18489.1 hypothetical protein Raf01_66610 [Rugosimonospora africana]